MSGLRLFVALIIFFFGVAAVTPGSFAAKRGDRKAGQKTYNTLCATCHGNTGRGDGPAASALPVKVRSLADGKYVKTLTDEHLFKVIKEGGPSVGKSQFMPPWGAQLKDQDISNVVSYIRSLSSSSR